MMRSGFRRVLIALIAALLGSPMDRPSAAPPADTATVELKVIRYDEMEAIVRAQKGRVVVVDFWADYCLTCKKGMPYLVEMQKKYGSEGLVLMTITLDALDRKEAALKFLQEKKVTGPNFLLNEKVEFWQGKLKINGPPAAFIFDRDGKRAVKFDSDDPDKPYDHEDVEKTVKELLKAKP
jgi:thiol-disulfide isomerase/thioredoxin